MKSEFRIVKSVTLTLDEAEMLWLKRHVQNPRQADESETDREMRHNFWAALTLAPAQETP
jgi:hypothetical protein